MKAVTVLDYLRRFLSRVQQLSDKSRENLLDDAARRLEGRELEGEDDDISSFKISIVEQYSVSLKENQETQKICKV